ncbi:MAG: 2-phospho-L-lactate guanylyltransferase [SAR202 cluster bacterium]|nr:2-phospho-L-lactate guanylyltransferase [SAR202 cluster bacterium]
MEHGHTGVIAVVPMKPLSSSKTRLARTLTDQERFDLTIGMLRWVVTASVSQVDACWVVGGDERVRLATEDAGGVWRQDLGKDLNETLALAFQRVFNQGRAGLYLAGDLPFLKSADVHNMIQSSRRNTNITLAPARKDSGTNSILVPRGLPFQPELGPRSFQRHLAQSARLGVSVAMCYSPGLGFDLDTFDDLETYESMEPGLLARLVPSWAEPSSGLPSKPLFPPGGNRE